VHANKIRKFHVRVDEVLYDSVLFYNNRKELLTVLDQLPECFSETPGLCYLVEHAIPVTAEFRPKRLKPIE